MKAATSAKPTITWKACAATPMSSSRSRPGSVQNRPNAIAVIASQRHIRARASAKAAAVTTAR